jgi:hypothetical protein
MYNEDVERKYMDQIKETFEKVYHNQLNLEKTDAGQYQDWETLKAFSYFKQGWTQANKVETNGKDL